MNQSEPNQPKTAQPVDELISSLCATIPDYPKPGISFKDLTPVFADGAALAAVVNALIEPFEGQFDAIAGVEAMRLGEAFAHQHFDAAVGVDITPAP